MLKASLHARHFLVRAERRTVRKSAQQRSLGSGVRTTFLNAGVRIIFFRIDYFKIVTFPGGVFIRGTAYVGRS